MMQIKQPAPREGVEDRYCQTADDFLKLLSPRRELFRPGEGHSWLFRGHANADWELKASWMRSTDVFKKYGVLPLSEREHVFEGQPRSYRRSDFQMRLLRRFREGLDRSGLVIPGTAPRLGVREAHARSGQQPEPDALPLLALAQHHGLPTMLLDWTRRAWVAAYFAAEEAASLVAGIRRQAPGESEPATHLAVWALRRERDRNPVGDLYFYEAPGGTNPNLHAQAGLFTYHVTDEDLSLERYFVRMKENAAGVSPPLLRRMILPTTEAPKLLRLLSDEGIDAGAMFPGAGGVVRTMLEHASWDSPPRYP